MHYFLNQLRKNEIQNIIRELLNISQRYAGIIAYLIKNVTDENVT